MASVFKRGGKKSKGFWYASWTGHNGKRVTKCTRTTDKSTAERIAKKHEADAALRRDGVIDAALDAISQQSQRTIDSHISDFKRKLKAADRSDKHINFTTDKISEIANYAGFELAADIDADGVNRYAGMLRDDLNRSSRTIKAHLDAITAFTKWLSDNHKLPRNPLSSVKKPNPKTDRRLERRMLLPDEWRRLEIATDNGPVRCDMTPGERLLLYRTAIQSGLRSNELRSRTQGSLYLEGGSPYIVCKAGTTKNKKLAKQYIQPSLAAGLADHISTKAPKMPVFDLPHESNLARMIRADLHDARQQWLDEVEEQPQELAKRQQSDFLADVNHEGEAFDFHALRHTCGAWLAMAGEHPKVVQTVMRHQSIGLTMDTYGHLFPGSEAEAVGRMWERLTDNLQKPVPAGDTDDAVAEIVEIAQRQAQRTGRERGTIACERGATVDTPSNSTSKKEIA